MIKKYFNVVDKNEIYEIVRIVGRECQVINSDDRCETGYLFLMCLQKVIDDHEDFFRNLVDNDTTFQWN